MEAIQADLGTAATHSSSGRDEVYSAAHTCPSSVVQWLTDLDATDGHTKAHRETHGQTDKQPNNDTEQERETAAQVDDVMQDSDADRERARVIVGEATNAKNETGNDITAADQRKPTNKASRGRSHIGKHGKILVLVIVT